MSTTEAPPMSDLQALEERLRLQEVAVAVAKAEEKVRWYEQEKLNDTCAEDRKELRVHIDGKFAVVFKALTQLEIKVAVYAASGTILATLGLKFFFP